MKPCLLSLSVPGHCHACPAPGKTAPAPYGHLGGRGVLPFSSVATVFLCDNVHFPELWIQVVWLVSVEGHQGNISQSCF